MNNSAAQNLVPNPSFEEYLFCPDAENQVQYATGWKSYCSTPDYFNVCSPNPHLAVPHNFYGSYQPAADSNAYCGFFSYWKWQTYTNVRDHIGTQLQSPLIIGRSYYISFKVSLANNGASASCATNRIGAKFSTISYEAYGSDSITSPAVNNYAHVYTSEVITDTANWVTISGSFIADSAYEYLIIGNFFTDSQTDTLLLPPYHPYCTAYYYADEVCVSDNSKICNVLTGLPATSNDSEITAYPNPFITATKIYIRQENLNEELQIALYDMSGKLHSISYKIERLPELTNIIIERGELSTGVYSVKILTPNQIFTKKLSIIN